MNQFLSGAQVVACAAIALFFVKYWRATHDRLFAILAFSFILLGVERSVLAFVPVSLEGRHWIFLARLLAFVLIIVGVLDKNRPRKAARRERAPRRARWRREARQGATS